MARTLIKVIWIVLSTGRAYRPPPRLLHHRIQPESQTRKLSNHYSVERSFLWMVTTPDGEPDTNHSRAA